MEMSVEHEHGIKSILAFFATPHLNSLWFVSHDSR